MSRTILKTACALCCVLPLYFLVACKVHKNTISIIDVFNSPESQFALSDLRAALKQANYTIAKNGKILIKIEKDTTLHAQGFKIIKTQPHTSITIKAKDDNGAMYGIMELTEQIEIHGNFNSITTAEQHPFVPYRGIKMNVALDGRLPSYDDTGDAAQLNIPEMWNIEFWKAYLDDLARHRYNLLSLWSKHPFPALCKLNDYPGAAMEDVYVYKKPITWDMQRDWEGLDVNDTTNFKKIKTLSIDEKINFWKAVMAHAHDRGIDVVWFTWNIFISPGTGEITNPESDEAITYMRKAVKEMVETYPHLSGFGVTAGERMGMTVGEYSAPSWMFETYGKGVIEAIKNEENRPFRFIFRRHHAFLETIQNDFASKFPRTVETSYKYNVAHMYSSPKPPIFEREYLPDVKKYNFKCWMNLRNDDIFTFRWGDPDYVREYLINMMDYGVVPGFYMGSDGYLWGREFTSKIPELSGELEIKKHWYRYMLWGRLAYDPNLNNERLQGIISAKFPETKAKPLFHAWRYASKIIPLVNNFHWKPADAMWAVEGCMDQYNGFQDLRDFIDCYTLESDKLQNITDYVIDLKNNGVSNKTNPLQVADSLRFCAKQARTYLADLKTQLNNPSEALKATINDIECFALYGDYYAGKIAGATYLHMYESLNNNKKNQYKTHALTETKLAQDAWEALSKKASAQYKTQLLARTRELNWEKTIPHVKNDVAIVNASTGFEPKIAKLFYSGHANITKNQQDKIRNYLVGKGYKVEVYPGWKTEAYATGLKIAFAVKGGLVSQFYTSRGGEYPEDFDKKGYIIKDLHTKLWVVGKDVAQANAGVDALITHLEKHLN